MSSLLKIFEPAISSVNSSILYDKNYFTFLSEITTGDPHDDIAGFIVRAANLALISFPTITICFAGTLCKVTTIGGLFLS